MIYGVGTADEDEAVLLGEEESEDVTISSELDEDAGTMELDGSIVDLVEFQYLIEEEDKEPDLGNDDVEELEVVEEKELEIEELAELLMKELVLKELVLKEVLNECEIVDSDILEVELDKL